MEHEIIDQVDSGEREVRVIIGSKVEKPPTYSILMITHNTLEVTRLATLRVLRHSIGHDARLTVVDNASTDGTREWLEMLAARGDLDLIRSAENIGHGPGLERARQQTRAPYLVTLDSDAFPLADDWLPCLRARLQDPVRVVGILHHRNYIHPSCLMIARGTLDEFGLTFLNEKHQPSPFDVAERISHEIRQRGYAIAGLRRTGAQRHGSIREPVYLGAEYEGLVYHQWYTTRSVLARHGRVDDVPPEALARARAELLERYHAEPRDLTVVVGARAGPDQAERQRNTVACLRALNLQDLPRWRYRIIVVEQDARPHLEQRIAPWADRYLFAPNPGPYNRGWAFNIGATLPGGHGGALCLVDADVLGPPGFLRQGLETLRARRRAVLPYGEVAFLDPTATAQALRDRFAAPLASLDTRMYAGRVVTTTRGLCLFVDAALYHQLGGYDERFRGWGREDREFWNRLAAATPVKALPERILHLDHPRPSRTDAAARENRRLYARLTTQGRRSTTPPSPMGDPNRYIDEMVKVSPALAKGPQLRGMREWEQWHRWGQARIERIVRDERARPPAASLRRQLARLVVTLGDQVLDLGCGPGALWPHLEPHRPRVSWTGVDVTARMVQTARRLFPGVPVVQADGGQLPFSTASFDVVVGRHLLEHLPPWLLECTLNEALRVARRALVLVFHVAPAPQGPRAVDRVGEGFLQTRWATADVEEPIRRAGWHIEKRTEFVGQGRERDVVWVVRRREAVAESVPPA